MTEAIKPKRGGAQPGAGRPKGVKNKRTLELQASVAASGITPLEFLLERMRQPTPDSATLAQIIELDAMRMQAAVAAAPYVHAKLSAVQVSGGLQLNHESALDELE